MLEQLFQTVKDFFIEVPAIKNLIDNVRSGDTNIFSGFVSVIKGVFGGLTSGADE
ncbi:MAG: hypothetical protein IJ766_09420 [Clostridia bacterium]|nr:hypothetical protein [Clostridia bacterium]